MAEIQKMQFILATWCIKIEKGADQGLKLLLQPLQGEKTDIDRGHRIELGHLSRCHEAEHPLHIKEGNQFKATVNSIMNVRATPAMTFKTLLTARMMAKRGSIFPCSST
jgi:hypothetical protein